MLATEAATVEDIDVALGYMTRDLHIAVDDGNETRATVLRRQIDRLLDKRMACG